MLHIHFKSDACDVAAWSCRFSLDAEDPVIKKYDGYTRRIQAVLLQQRHQPVTLEEQVCGVRSSR